MEDIPNYSTGKDGIDYVFEIATRDKYRMFHYWTPSLYSDKVWQAKNVTLISELLQNEFALDNTE